LQATFCCLSAIFAIYSEQPNKFYSIYTSEFKFWKKIDLILTDYPRMISNVCQFVLRKLHAGGSKCYMKNWAEADASQRAPALPVGFLRYQNSQSLNLVKPEPRTRESCTLLLKFLRQLQQPKFHILFHFHNQTHFTKTHIWAFFVQDSFGRVIKRGSKIQGQFLILWRPNQKFQTKICGKSGIFWKRNSNVSFGRRVKIQKSMSLSFSFLQLFHLHLRRRSKGKVTFCDPETFKLKFEYERTLLGYFWVS